MSTQYEDFIKEMKESLDAHMLPQRVIEHLFSDSADFYPYCDGECWELSEADCVPTTGHLFV